MHNDDSIGEEPPGPLWNSANTLTVMLPFAATVIALVFGMLIGGAVVWVVKPTSRPIEYLKTASLAELEIVCEPVVEEQKTQLAKVKSEIVDLKAEVQQKEALVAELRAELKGKPDGGGASSPRTAAAAITPPATPAELSRAKEDLAEAKLQLRMLNQVKDQLVDQLTRTQQRLTQTEADLQAQVAITEVLRDENLELQDDVIVQRWFRMVTESQLDLCEKGSRRKTEACRQAVVSELSDIKREFVHCIRSGQAAPSVEPLERGKALPHFARMLDQGNKFLAGHYLQMCDPTLPETEIPPPSTASPSRF
ncbi:MAG: hypothetical protein KTR31_41520 [Myxococcales bacterium]|nr:hypothetical protein [Myxococcales bacterium]